MSLQQESGKINGGAFPDEELRTNDRTLKRIYTTIILRASINSDILQANTRMKSRFPRCDAARTLTWLRTFRGAVLPPKRPELQVTSFDIRVLEFSRTTLQ